MKRLHLFNRSDRLRGKSMPNIPNLLAANGKRWVAAKSTRDASGAARRLVAAKARYQAVAARTGVPWFLVAVVHERECSQNWSGSLAQGDPWNKVSVHIPAGRGPFKSWEDAAIDALVNCAPHAARWKDWTAGGALTLLEQYNGLGYANRGVPSPYVWSGTDQYRSGKYVRDGVYDPAVVDRQLGCAGLLKAMMALDPSINFADARAMRSHPPPPIDSVHPKPSVLHPAKGSLGAFFVAVLKFVFGRK
jgi:lysozyme family protein